MILPLFGYKNCESGLFSLPFNVSCEREQIADYFKEGLTYAPETTLKSMISDDLYVLGEFDTCTGIIKPCCDFVLHLNPIVEQILASREAKKVKEGDNDGKVN